MCSELLHVLIEIYLPLCHELVNLPSVVFIDTRSTTNFEQTFQHFLRDCTSDGLPIASLGFTFRFYAMFQDLRVLGTRRRRSVLLSSTRLRFVRRREERDQEGFEDVFDQTRKDWGRRCDGESEHVGLQECDEGDRLR